MPTAPRRLEVAVARPGDLEKVVVEALSPRYRVDRSAARTVRRTALDTFDHRLAAAGLTLELRRAGDRDVLVLSRPDAPPLSSQAAGLEIPALADRLPAGALRNAVRGPMKLRALLAQDEQRRRVQVLTIRDGQDKAVVRVELDAPVRPGAAGRGSALLTVSPLRGYDADGDRVLGLLSRLPGAAEPSTPQEEPDDAAVPALDRSTPAPVAVASVVSGYLAEMRRNVPGLVDDVDTEFLHDFRVAVRRTRSTLKLSRAVLDRDGTGVVAHHEAEAKRLGDLTSPLRDLDVHLLDLPTMAGWLVSADPADLDPFAAHLRRRRAAAHRALVRAVRSKRSQEFLTDWTGELVRTAGDGAQVTADALSRECISRAHRRVVKQGSAIGADSPAEDLHTLRKRCKELRYALEMFTPLHDPGTTGRAISDLKKLQDCLGRFQDTEVQQAAVRTFAAEMAAAGTAPSATLLAMGELITHLETDQRRARADFTGTFARFTGPATTKRLRALGTGGRK